MSATFAIFGKATVPTMWTPPAPLPRTTDEAAAPPTDPPESREGSHNKSRKRREQRKRSAQRSKANGEHTSHSPAPEAGSATAKQARLKTEKKLRAVDLRLLDEKAAPKMSWPRRNDDDVRENNQLKGKVATFLDQLEPEIHRLTEAGAAVATVKERLRIFPEIRQKCKRARPTAALAAAPVTTVPPVHSIPFSKPHRKLFP